MSSTKPAIVLVPGAFHHPSHYSGLESALSKAGYSVTVCDLPSTGGPEPVLSISPDVDCVRRAIERHVEGGVNVALVMHSYGGLPGSCAARGLRVGETSTGAGVVRLVYLCAFVIDDGLSLFTAMGTGSHAAWARPLGEPNTGIWIAWDKPPATARQIFYNDCTPDVADEAERKLRFWSESCAHSPCTYAAWKEIESDYLICTIDETVPPAAQEAMSAQEGGRWRRVERLHSGHSPFLSKLEETVAFVRRGAGEDLS